MKNLLSGLSNELKKEMCRNMKVCMGAKSLLIDF